MGQNAVECCTGLTSVTISDGVTTIGNSAFYKCTGLKSIIIPESVTFIGQDAFYNCISLKTINYTGTQVQWNAISKGTSWKSGTTVNVIYNYKPE